ncbi:chromosomal replication initiator protein DnaA [Buchnera aphidicola (Neophyllaphis podocarpi)]|uniref:chromosomal replication initiator protein DnaA n=1 Tax=Buchnera aphidicola TaxID=9 RepID=UPI0031B89EA3
MSLSLWKQCIIQLQNELKTTEFSMWIRPLKAKLQDKILTLYAPNKFVLNWVKDKYLNNLKKILNNLCGKNKLKIKLKILSKSISLSIKTSIRPKYKIQKIIPLWKDKKSTKKIFYNSKINKKNNFNNFVEGKSNKLAKKAAIKVVKNLGKYYNPLFLYSKTGLGKTHLLHAIVNQITQNKYNAKVIYMHSEKFVQNMVKALKNNLIEKFKKYYRSVDAFLIDDIQFFANKERSQEELFHTFNDLLEKNQQIIITCDRYPKEIIGVEDRLKSRLSWGLTISIDQPELETRIAILIKKASEKNILLTYEVACFIAKNLNVNVRELEGALNKIIANSSINNKIINLELANESLKDILIFKQKKITIYKVQKIVANYYKIKFSDLISRSRKKIIVRPRQIAMTIIKKLTNHSLSEIGNAFGGKDHTTVLHACRKVEQLCKKYYNIKKDFSNLINKLS